MKNTRELNNILEKITHRDSRYKIESYFFILEALNYTVGKLPRPRHLTAQELLAGIKDFALEKFGPMAGTVFEEWGVHDTLDFGNIVFKLIEVGLLSRQEEDKLEDFKNGYEFKATFGSSRYRYQIDNSQ